MSDQALFDLLQSELRERLEALPRGSTRKDIADVCNDVIAKFTAAQIIVERDPHDENRINVLLPLDWKRRSEP